MAKVIEANWVEDSNGYVMAYVLAADGTPLVAADVASLTYSIYEQDPSDGSWSVVSGHSAVSLSPVSTYVFDTVRDVDDDPRWNLSGGYNFLHNIAYTAFPDGSRNYRYECKIIETGGAHYFVRATGPADAISSS